MAHRSNVIQVLKDTSKEDIQAEQVTDPVCGMKMPRRDSKFMLFHLDDTYFFCSKECQLKFISSRKHHQKAAS